MTSEPTGQHVRVAQSSQCHAGPGVQPLRRVQFDGRAGPIAPCGLGIGLDPLLFQPVVFLAAGPSWLMSFCFILVVHWPCSRHVY